jgi:hypothetical protein
VQIANPAADSLPKTKQKLPASIVLWIRFQIWNYLMSDKLNKILLLQMAIERFYKCEAAHCKTVIVDEKFQGKCIWRGAVEVYEVTGCPGASRCFAWMEEESGKSGRPVALLNKWPVISPETAVRTAIALDLSSNPSTLNPPAVDGGLRA